MTVVTLRLCRIIGDKVSDKKFINSLSEQYAEPVSIIGDGTVIRISSGKTIFIATRNAESAEVRSSHFIWANPAELPMLLFALPDRLTATWYERSAHSIYDRQT